MKKVLFLIHDLGPGGAEKVLVNLANRLDRQKFDVTVQTLFDVGVNKERLEPHVHYRGGLKWAFPGNSRLMQLFSPEFLHRLLIRDDYDILVSYLEGPSARIICGCPDKDKKIYCWVHIQMHNVAEASVGFRSPDEAYDYYSRANTVVFVSESVRETFLQFLPLNNPTTVLYNTNLSNEIRCMAAEPCTLPDGFNWCGIGKLIPRKGFDRLLRVHKRLREEGLPVHFHLLGSGPLEVSLRQWCEENGIAHTVQFHGYLKNPYALLAKCDLFACASHGEGFSTAATEALIVGTPVCTTDVAGMREMLGEHNEYGVVTADGDEALYQAVRKFVVSPDYAAEYRQKAAERGEFFSAENTVRAVERLFEDQRVPEFEQNFREQFRDVPFIGAEKNEQTLH